MATVSSLMLQNSIAPNFLREREFLTFYRPYLVLKVLIFLINPTFKKINQIIFKLSKTLRYINAKNQIQWP
jgi:hypothetical protein